MTISSSDVRKGGVILYNGAPHIVVSHDIHKTGRGGSHNKTKVKNISTGAVIPVTFSGNDKVEVADVSNKNIQYLYNDGADATFMDPNSFEQVVVPIENIPGELDFLKEGELYQGAFYEEKVISLILPKKMSLKVISAPEGARGDSASNPQKEITLETGLVINAPLFVKPDEIVYVNTDTYEYGGRDNE